MKTPQHGSENQTTVVFVARQAVLSDPFKTVKLRTFGSQ